MENNVEAEVIKEITDGDKTKSTIMHLLAFVLGIFSPLLFIIFSGGSTFVKENAKESINFHLTLILYYFLSVVAIVVLIGFILVPLVFIYHGVCLVMSAVRVSNGEVYRFPLNIRIIQ